MSTKQLDILLIEDCLEDIDLAKEVLKEHKIQNRLKVINDGQKAIDFLRDYGLDDQKNFPDVIVLDLNIPKRNGFAVLEEIVNNRLFKQIPIIIFTTTDLTQEALNRYHVDFSCYVKKSIDFHELAEALRAVEPGHGESDILPPVTPSQEGAMNILLVEDNIADADLIRELLFMKDMHQWKIRHFERLQEALDCLDQEKFDVAVLDLFLPDARGIDTLKRFVSHKSSLPLVVMTGLSDGNLGKEAIHEGAQDYLVKGRITSDHFIKSIEYAIERKKLELMKDELLSYVNHELSNPLTVVRESVKQVSEGLFGKVNDRQKHFLHAALSSINRLVMITEDLLLSTKLELGRLSIKKETFNFNELILESMESFQAAFSQKGVALKSFLPAEPVDVCADRGRIGQVVSNLLNNALKFTAEGCVTIGLEAKGNVLQCRVSDTGEGIAQENIQKLFQKYEQLLEHKRKGRKGTGLGLYICKTLIEMHDGDIHVESCLGKGTDFFFTLPLNERG